MQTPTTLDVLGVALLQETTSKMVGMLRNGELFFHALVGMAPNSFSWDKNISFLQETLGIKNRN